MIKFFRKIRLKLLTKKNFSKYLAYAIGEILLVVIGIIIALQLNNWNGDRKEMNAELQLYYSMLIDLKSEYNRLETQINYTSRYDALHKHIYNESLGKEPYNPDNFFNYLLWFHRYDMLFNEKFSEFLTSITNDEINRYLKEYLKQEKITFNSVEEFNEHQVQHVRSYLSKHSINSDETMFTENVNDFGTLINRMNLINYSNLKKQYGSEELNQLLFTIRFKNLWMAQNFVWLQEQNRHFQLILGMKMASTKLADSFDMLEPITIAEFNTINKSHDEIIDIITREVKDSVSYNFTETEINRFGYQLISAEKYQDAVTVFRLNIELNPSWNTYDSYGEGLLKIGEIDEGLKAYKKSIELNPDNINAKEVIESHKNIN